MKVNMEEKKSIYIQQFGLHDSTELFIQCIQTGTKA